MKLYCNRPSPYVRKVLVTAHESGLIDSMEIEEVDPWRDPAQLHAASPVGKIPALITDSGILMTESLLICDFLFSEAGEAATNRSERLDEMSRSGFYQGLIDAAFISVIEFRRPAERQWKDWIDRQHRAIRRTLTVVKTPPAGRFDLGDISLACGLAYLDFRLQNLGWRNEHPELANWLDEISNRSSMVATNPAA